MMTSLAKRPDGRWRARYRDEAGVEHSRHFPRKVDGQCWLDEVTTATRTGNYVDPRRSRTTLEAYAKEWQARQIGRPATQRITDVALRVHINPALGSRRIGSIRHGDVQGFVKGLEATLAPWTVRSIFDVLARVFASAVEDRMLPVSPCRKITLPPTRDDEITPPTVAEVQTIAATMVTRYRAAVVLLAGSGLRVGELLGLRISDVDFDARTVRVERQRLQNGSLGEPKTRKSKRTVPVGNVVVEALELHLEQYPSDEWLFTTEAGKPLDYSTWRKAWETARGRAGSSMVSHDLRHFFASCLIASGVGIKQVQAVLGHQSPTVTLTVYSHLWPGGDDETRAVVDGALEVLRTTCGPSGGVEPVPAGSAGLVARATLGAD